MSKQNRSVEVKIRMTPDEKHQLRVEAAKAGLGMAEYLRFCALGKGGLKSVSIPHLDKYAEIMTIVKPISNNTNQIAKWMNTYKGDVEPALASDVQHLIEHLRTFDADLKSKIAW